MRRFGKKRFSGSASQSGKKIIFIIIGVIFLIIVIAAIFLLPSYLRTSGKELNASIEIESVIVSMDSVYLKLSEESINKTYIKFIFEDFNGDEYYYEVINDNETSVPSKKGFFDILKLGSLAYDYKIDLDEIEGLDSFENITRVRVVFSAEIMPPPTPSPTTPSTAPSTTPPSDDSGNGDGGGNGDGNGDGDCTPDCTGRECGSDPDCGISCGTCADDKTCSDGLCVDVCVPDSNEVTCGDWVCGFKTNNCGEDLMCGACENNYTCFEGYCINQSRNCTDYKDVDYYLKDYVYCNESGNWSVSLDICIDFQNLTEFICEANEGDYTIGNETVECEFNCSEGRCFCGPTDCSAEGIFCDNLTVYNCSFDENNCFERANLTDCGEGYICAEGVGCSLECNDSDIDGYGVCPNCGIENECLYNGEDCNDTNTYINPNASEICGNEVDEDCDGLTPTCFEFGRDAYWKCNDDLSDGIAEEEINGYDGTCSGDNCPIFRETEGVSGTGACEFDGTEDSLLIPSVVFSNNESFSISLWIKPDPTSDQAMIIYANAGSTSQGIVSLWYEGGMDNNIVAYNNYGLDLQTERDSINTGQLNHVVLVYNKNSGAELYINNISKATDDSVSEIDYAVNVFIGKKINTNYFNGLIDEVMIYNRALTAEEVAEIYNSQMQGEFSTLGFWDRIIDWFKGLFS